LAVIKANAGKLLDKQQEDTQNIDELNKIYSAATKLSQAQKSLLLLSKINNMEFSNNVSLNLAQVLLSSFETFSEAINIREIKVTREIETCTVFMDAGLAGILINNLIKNSVKHNLQQGYITIKLTAEMLEIENSGPEFKGNPNSLLQRFSKGENGNIGIGLAIVKQICELYQFTLSYKISEKNHKITVLLNPV